MDILQELNIDICQKNIISLAGSGGKTTLLYALCDIFRKKGRRTGALTTTNILCPPSSEGIQCIIDDDIYMANTVFEDGKILVAGTPTKGNNLTLPKSEMLKFLLKAADVVVAEADGAQNMPIKFPNEAEPVLLPQTTHLFVVAGLSAIGHPLCEVCHRWPLAMAMCGIKGQHSVVTPQMFADILMHGYYKYAPVFVLNQADSEETAAQGREVAALLLKQGISSTIIMSLKADKVWH